MESEWRVYLKENAPELYEAMLADVKWAAKWRDDLIGQHKLLLARSAALLKRYASSLDLDRCECEGSECFCGANDLSDLLVDFEAATK